MTLSTQLRRFTIRSRMYSAIGVVFALLMLVGGAGWVGIQHVEALASDYQHHNFKETRTVALLQEASGEVHAHAQAIVLHAGQAEQLNTIIRQWQSASDKMRELAAVMLEGEEDDDNAIVRDMLSLLTQHQATMNSALDALRSGELRGQAALARLDPTLATTALFRERLAAIDKVMVAESSEAMQAQMDVAHTTALTFCGVVMVAMLIVGPLTVLNQRSICAPLHQASQVALAISKGHLRNDILDDGQDETADLLRALAQMQGSLTSMVTAVRVSADSITVASTEIASGNMDLSTRTEGAASSLQQTASSMEQLSQTFVESSDAAVQANDMAAQAAQVAERGHGIVSGVVRNMGEIQQTSQRIQDIIGVIDGIAFQTNILALNAAVEAARAGEQGRGFAVVASEVRSLAQRSAGAAREIKTLIDASSDTVRSGTQLVQEAGQAMGEILQSISRVSSVMSEITTTTSQQRHGMGQINQAVMHLDQMTQQNAALVEQSAAASASLHDQAERLKTAMSAFHI